MVDLFRYLRVEIAERIVGQRREMHYGVIAAQLLRVHVSQVHAYRRELCRPRALRSKGAVLEEEGVEPSDLVSGLVKYS